MALFQAAREGAAARVRQLVLSKANPNTRDKVHICPVQQGEGIIGLDGRPIHCSILLGVV